MRVQTAFGVEISKVISRPYRISRVLQSLPTIIVQHLLNPIDSC
jgi:hypothetical protein